LYCRLKYIKNINKGCEKEAAGGFVFQRAGAGESRYADICCVAFEPEK